MIDKIKKDMELKKGKKMLFRYNGSRNQVEEFNGVIINTYNYVFTIMQDNITKTIKSFSYADILTESLQILNNL